MWSMQMMKEILIWMSISSMPLHAIIANLKHHLMQAIGFGDSLGYI